MPTAEELLEAVYADPVSDAPRHVYADWLVGRGDRLGEFVALQLARRAQGKRTQAREKVLFAAESGGWWRDHPVARIERLTWEDTDRGFPHRFRPGWPVSSGFLREQEAAVAATTDSPGWATIGALHLSFESGPGPMERFLRGCRLPSLREIRGIGVALLESVADVPLPTAALEVFVPTVRPLPNLSAQRALRTLEVDIRTTLPRAIDAVEPCGALERLAELELRGLEGFPPFAEMLAVYRSLPGSIERLGLNRYYGQLTRLSGPRDRPSLYQSVTADDADGLVEALEALDAEAVSSVEIEFARGGYFTKRNRGPLLERVRRATAKWGERARTPAA